MGERMIYWMANRYDWKYVIFRYFNVAGAEMDASNGLREKSNSYHSQYQQDRIGTK